MTTPAALWAHYEAQPPGPDRLRFGALPDAALFAGVRYPPDGSAPERLLLLRLPRKLAATLKPDARHQGLRVEPVEDASDTASAFVSLVLADPRLRDIFSVLVEDVVTAVQDSAPEPAARLRTFLGRLARWRDLFRLYDPDGLSPAARQGLFGELWALRWLLTDGGLPASVALSAWVGPDHQAQDFRFGSAALEVKTTAGNGRSLHIASLLQLDDVLLGCPLFLLHLGLDADVSAPAGGFTLPALVADLTARFTPDTAAAARFEIRLQTAGYFHAQAELYVDDLWRPRPPRLLAVTADFPRLRASALPAPLTAATYELDATALEPWRCASETLFALLA